EPAQDEPAQDEPAQDEPAQDEPAQDEPAQDEPAQDEPAQDEPAQDAAEWATPTDANESKTIEDLPEDLIDVVPSLGQALICRPGGELLAPLGIEEVTTPDDELPVQLESTIRAYYLNSKDQLFSVYSTANDPAHAEEFFAYDLCVESYEDDGSALPPQQSDIADGDFFAQIAGEVEGGDGGEVLSEVQNALVEEAGELRYIFVVPEFPCEQDSHRIDDFASYGVDGACGNDELFGGSVWTTFLIDPFVGSNRYDRYSPIGNSDFVWAYVKAVRHSIYAAIRKHPGWTRLSGSGADQGQYTRFMYAYPQQVGPVWFSVHGRSNQTSEYLVWGSWRSQSYYK
ncbi:MAG: hypothetical protein AAF567_24215, partial [Actinomycetota bacterium]